MKSANDHHVSRAVAGHIAAVERATDDPAILNALHALDGRIAFNRKEFATHLRATESVRARIALVMLWGAARTDHLVSSSITGADASSQQDVWSRAAECRDEAATPEALQRAFLRLWRPPRYRRTRLPGASVAFGTKILYWAAVAAGESQATPLPLIYDQRVARSLRTLHGDDAWPLPVQGLPRQTYASYCLTATEWASQLACTPDDVEVTLFNADGDVGRLGDLTGMTDPVVVERLEEPQPSDT